MGLPPINHNLSSNLYARPLSCDKSSGNKAEMLLEQTNPNFASDDRKKLHPLQIVAMNGEMSMMMLLLDYRARIDCPHGKPNTSHAN